MESDIVSGQQSAWVLQKKLGEGDAGEVYQVESLLEKQAAILKRPVRSAFASDLIRQTAQIATESKILRGLSDMLKMDADFSVSVPNVLDQSRSGTTFSERQFIIIEKARGFDLAFLARLAQRGVENEADLQADTPEETRFLKNLAENNHMSERILLSALDVLLGLFERIHQRTFRVDGLDYQGILWNDVKPEHIFWDPWRAQFTIIDWGNGQFLEQDGATRDRRFSAEEDYRQLIEAMGRFFEITAPDLRSRLNWPSSSAFQLGDTAFLLTLREQVWDQLQAQLFGLREAREREAHLLQNGSADAGINPLHELEDLHRGIIRYGELPNYSGALNLALRHAARFAEREQFAEVEEMVEWAVGLPGGDAQQLHLVAHLARITSRAQTASAEQRADLRQAVQQALAADWPSVLWNLVSALRSEPEPDWWYALITAVRCQQLGVDAGDVQPLLIARRTMLTLQSLVERMESSSPVTEPAALAQVQNLARRMREDTIPNWLAMDPSPPHANLTYSEIEEILDEIGQYLPDARQMLQRTLYQPRAVAEQLLQFWEQRAWDALQGGLRQALLWDPNRKRVLRADQALRRTPVWLEKVQRGPVIGQHYQAFIADIEFEGRELRNQVGPSTWLDVILEGCRLLRRGAWPPDLFTSFPKLVQEMPWLQRFERRENLAKYADAPSAPTQPIFAPLSGSARGKLGLEQDLQLTAPLDDWVPEARGSSARVFSGQLRDAQGKAVQMAIKLMRMDKIEYALPLFREEVLILAAMHDVPGITPLWECGFLQLDEDCTLPGERESTVNPMLVGSLLRISPMIGQEFIQQLESRIQEKWTPYLAIEQRDPRENLLALCDASLTRGNYLPVADLLLMSIQICDILHEAHARNIVYRDHKILHYYWREAQHGIYMIDWNVARLHPEGLSAYDKQMDLVQFGARALHHILTGRTAPGALPLGPTRPDEIEQSAKSYETQWTYDDQRLPEDVRKILERVLAGDYNHAIELRDDLKQSFLNLPNV